MKSLLDFRRGSAHDLSFLPAKSVHSILTSPPYLGLRSYAGDQDVDWPEVAYAPMPGLPAVIVPAQRCALGAEADPFAFVGHLLHCLREWRRVLRDDGVCMVNLGDSYNSAASNMQNGAVQRNGYNQGYDAIGRQKSRGGVGLKPKDLMLIPPRFALAAQADGWYVRAAIVWAKGVSFLPDYAGSSMPESVEDRPARSHEEIYLLAKNKRYFWDQAAVREESNGGPKVRDRASTFKKMSGDDAHMRQHQGNPVVESDGTRNVRSVWVINPRPFSAAHFACWPEDLVDPMIRATTSERGCCPACGAPWVRVVEREGETPRDKLKERGAASYANAQPKAAQGLDYAGAHGNNTRRTTTTGWTPTCTCKEYKLRDDLTPEQKDYVLLRLQEYRNRVILHRDSIADSVQSENKPNGKEMCTMRESDGVVPQCLRED